MAEGNAPMVSEVSICNQALSWLSQEPINSLDQNSTTAEWMRNNYAMLRDTVIETHKWTFAEARYKSTSTEQDSWENGYAHTIPLDWVNVYRVFRSVSGTDPCNWIQSQGWRRVGASVVARETVIYMQGATRITDARKFTPMFVQALAARIAAEGAIPFTENRSLQSDMWNLYSLKLKEAAAVDGQQGTNEMIQSNSLVDARYGGGGR